MRTSIVAVMAVMVAVMNSAVAGLVFDQLLAEDDFDRANSTNVGSNWTEFVVGDSPWDDPGDTVDWSISSNELAAGARIGDSSARMPVYYTGYTLGTYVDPLGRGETFVVDVRTSNWSGIIVNLRDTSNGIDPNVAHNMLSINGSSGYVTLDRGRDYRRLADTFPGAASNMTIPGYSNANYYQYRVTTYPGQPGYVEAEIWSLVGNVAGGEPLALLGTVYGTDDGTYGTLSGGYVGIASLYGGTSGQFMSADNMRIGVIPEPATAFLLLVSCAGLALRRRR